jgi:putative peptide zinc metalloprotease protein
VNTPTLGTVDPRVQEVPARAEGLQLLGDMQGSGYRNPPALVRRADGQTLQLTRLLYFVLEAVDGHRSLDQIAGEASAAYGRSISGADVQKLIEHKLRPLGTLKAADGAEPAVERANPLLALRFRYAVTDPEVTRRITAPFAWLFHPLIVVGVVVGFVAVCRWVLFDRGLGFATHQAFANPALLLVVFAVTLVSAGFHEFGHAAAARYGGATPGAMGAGLYVLWPAFYTDVTDSYRLGRAGRIRTDLGGVYFNAVLALGVFGVWALTGWDALLLVIATQILQMVRQMPPLLRFDGYHLLADVTGVPDLYYRIRPTLAGLLPSNWGSAESKLLKPWAKAVVTVWVVLVVPFMIASVVLTVITLPRILATAAASVASQWRGMTGHFGAGDIPAGLAKLLGVIAVGLPVAGISYMLIRAVRQLGSKVWRATADRPVRRTIAVVAAGTVVAALAAAWWPRGDYRQVQPYERGTIQDALPATFEASGLHEGQRATARTLWPAGTGALPTAAHPVLALVLVPRPGQPGAAPAPTWVFPFNKPAPPGVGDNQSLAVNTKNGSTVYEVAFAMVWADSGHPVLNKNEAYAFADCQHCQTIAVSFQVVLIVGEAHVVVPQNISAAVNYNCVACVTQALAVQLVVTLPGTPLAQEKADLDALWQEIRTVISKYSPPNPATPGTSGSEGTAPATSITSNPGTTAPTPAASPGPAVAPSTTVGASQSDTTTLPASSPPTTAAPTGSPAPPTTAAVPPPTTTP